ncbi:MAG: Maf family protein [Firmicutes bacterium]|nr:Maf family protein [Bacillota bacterium]
MKKIVLASASPRRQALLRQAGIDFELRVPDVDEHADGEDLISPYDLVKILSERKALEALKAAGDSEVIIAADTVVALGGAVMGKPAGADGAAEMLRRLGGKKHSVYTGLAMINKNPDGYEMKSLVDTTEVYMRALTEAEIAAYIGTGEPFDKAGAYAIQGKGAFLIEGIEGDFYTVMGLPLVKVYLALREWGIEI